MGGVDFGMIVSKVALLVSFWAAEIEKNQSFNNGSSSKDKLSITWKEQGSFFKVRFSSSVLGWHP